MKEIKLNLGGGNTVIDGFINVDRKTGQEVYPLEYPENSVSEIRASHILEHFGLREIGSVLKDWYSKLVPGGLIKIAVPDLDKIVDMIKNKTDEKAVMYLMGDQKDSNHYHKSAFDKASLVDIMKHVGFVNVQEWHDDIMDSSNLPVSLNIMGYKPAEEKTTIKRKISAVMSMPRLMFSDNMTCLMKAVVSKGIPLMRSSGVFWGQCLTRLFEGELKKEDLDYILTIDYDSWFSHGDIMKLCQILENNPEYDAVMPVQIRREKDAPLVGIKPKDGDKYAEISKKELIESDIYPVDTGHFGLTVFRKSCFSKLKKPWFMPKPDPDGGWGDDRHDEDIMFWLNFKESGCKLGLAPNVRIGHLQMRVTYPGTVMEDWKPVHMSMSEADDIEVRDSLIRGNHENKNA